MNVPAVGDARGTGLSGYLLAVSRPRFWLYLGGTALVGIVWGADRLAALLDPVALAVVVYFLVPANLFLYGVNDRFDATTDAANPRKGDAGPEVRYRRDRRVDAAVLAGGLLGLGLVPALPAVGGVAVVAFLALAVAYSVPPARFKARPLLDSLSNGLYVLPGVAGYALAAGRPPPGAVLLAGWLWTMGMHTFSAIPDIGPDRDAGIRTTATAIGAPRALGYVVGCWFGAAVAAAAHRPALGLVFLAYPAVGTAIVVRGVDVSRAYRWFPSLNGLVGMALTLAGLWRLTGGL